MCVGPSWLQSAFKSTMNSCIALHITWEPIVISIDWRRLKFVNKLLSNRYLTSIFFHYVYQLTHFEYRLYNVQPLVLRITIYIASNGVSNTNNFRTASGRSACPSETTWGSSGTTTSPIFYKRQCNKITPKISYKVTLAGILIQRGEFRGSEKDDRHTLLWHADFIKFKNHKNNGKCLSVCRQWLSGQ